MTDDDVSSAPGLVRGLDRLGGGDVAVAGGKGAGLGELLRAGARVPPGFVVTTDAFRRAVESVDPGGQLRAVVGSRGDDARREDAMARLRAGLGSVPLPPGLDAAVRRAYPALGGDDVPVAVRSSATGEDGPGSSFAGLHGTRLWVTGAQAVLAGLRECWAGLYEPGSVSYRLRRGIPEDGVAMAVVVQRMVRARTSGVLFTRSPLSGDRSVVVVEAAWGLGSAVVSGSVTPDSWVVAKAGGEVLDRRVATKLRRHRADPAAGRVVDEEVPAQLRTAPALTPQELTELVAAALSVERHHGTPQDIEWALAEPAARDADRPGDAPDGDGSAGLFLLQSRPETVWSGREATG